MEVTCQKGCVLDSLHTKMVVENLKPLLQSLKAPHFI